MIAVALVTAVREPTYYLGALFFCCLSRVSELIPETTQVRSVAGRSRSMSFSQRRSASSAS